MKYYLYILETVDDTLYTGIATDVLKRFNDHINKKGAKYTKSHKPLKIVYVDEFSDKSEASKEEYRIKKTLNKTEKLELIELYKNRTEEYLKSFQKIKGDN